MIHNRITVSDLEWDIFHEEPKFADQVEQIAQGIRMILPDVNRYLLVPLIRTDCYQEQMITRCIPYLKSISQDSGNEDDENDNELLRDLGLLTIRRDELYRVESTDLIRTAVKEGNYACVILLYEGETRLAEQLYNCLLIYDRGIDTIVHYKGINEELMGVPVIRLEVPLRARVDIEFKEYRMAPITSPESMRQAAMLLSCGIAKAVNPHIPLDHFLPSLSVIGK